MGFTPSLSATTDLGNIGLKTNQILMGHISYLYYNL